MHVGVAIRSVLANIIAVLRKKGIKIYGIQHGGSYNLVDYKFLHKVSDLDFCDKYLSYGVSNKIHKKIIDFGSLKSIYYENQIKNLIIIKIKKI